ncbi:hypothetical protein GC163_05880 [bacterium]|nr:hypothetical protein [bacterium]
MSLPIIDADQVIVTAAGDVHGSDTPASRELARRIKACVNACEGMSTEDLEAGIIQDMARVIAQVVPILEDKVRPAA